MASESALHRLYFALEDAYYSLMDFLNNHGLPVYKYYVVPVERKGIPSFAFSFVLLFLVAVGGFGLILYGGPAFDQIRQLIPVSLEFPTILPATAKLRFSVEAENGDPIWDAVVEVYDQGTLIASNKTLNGVALFEAIPLKMISYNISKRGFRSAAGEVDTRVKTRIFEILDCIADCVTGPAGQATPTPIAVVSITPTPFATATPLPSPLARRSLRVSLVDNNTRLPVSTSGTVVAKDSVSLIEIERASLAGGAAAFQALVVGSRVVFEAEAEGYARAVSQPTELNEALFTTGVQLSLAPITADKFGKTTIRVLDQASNPLSATAKIFQKDQFTPFATLEVAPNGTAEITLQLSLQWFVLVNRTGYVDYASPFFSAGETVTARMQSLFNGTLQYCRVEAPSDEVGINDPVSIRMVYANLSAPPQNVTLFCGTDPGQQFNITQCFGTTGNCTGQCVYSQAGSKAIYAQIGDLNCRSTPVIALNVTYRGPTCFIQLDPESIPANGSTSVAVRYNNLTSAPIGGVLLVNCGNGVVEARNCAGTSGNCTTICRYDFSPAQVLDNPTRPVFVSFGGAQCIRDVKFADTAASLDAGVLFRASYLRNGRVGLFKWMPNQQNYFFLTSGVASNGRAFFDRLVRGDRFKVQAADASGILGGSSITTLDFPANDVNVSVELPAAFFNATARDAATRSTTPALAAANVVFSAYCNDLTLDGTGYTRIFSLASTCTAINASCLLSARAFVSCFVNGTSPAFTDVGESRSYQVSASNQVQLVERVFTACGGRNQPCCGTTCSSGLSCSQSVCRESVQSTDFLAITGENGQVSSNVAEVVMRVDPVFAADAVPLNVDLRSGCSSLAARLEADPKLAPCFNDVSSPSPATLKFDSSRPGCLVKSSGLSMQGAEANLFLRCSGNPSEKKIKLKVVGSSGSDAASYSPSSLVSTGVSNLVYVSTQKQLEAEVLEIAAGIVTPLEIVDTQPPTVSILEPTTGSAVTGSVEVLVDARDNSRVASVTLFVSNSSGEFQVGSATFAPYKIIWDASSAGLGSHRLRAEARAGRSNSASASVDVSRKQETTLASNLQGLNNIAFDVDRVYFAFSRGIGVLSPPCPSTCDYAVFPGGGTAQIGFVGFAPLSQRAFLGFQNDSGASNLAKRVVQAGSGLLVPAVNSTSFPQVFADSSLAYFHKQNAIGRTDGDSTTTVGDLTPLPTGVSYDANSVYVSYNDASGGKIGKKGISESGGPFTTLVSRASPIKSIAAKDGWVYWLEESPATACKMLASGAGVVSCATARLGRPFNLLVDSSGATLFFMDGASLKRISTDWSNLLTLATGLEGVRGIALGPDHVFISQINPVTGKGVIKNVSKNP